MIDHADNHNATPYFASIGICNSDGKKNDEEKSLPVKGQDFMSVVKAC